MTPKTATPKIVAVQRHGIENISGRTTLIDGFVEVLRLAERSEGRSIGLHDRVSQYFVALRDPVYGYLARFCGSTSDAEDLTQEAFLRLYRHLRGGKEIDNVRSWLFQVARNLAVSRARSQCAEDALELGIGLASEAPNSEDFILERERDQRLRVAMRELTDFQRQCLHLRAEGLRYREIAETLSANIDSVADALERAIRKLRSKVHA